MRSATDTERLLGKLRNKEYRDAFVANQISIGLPFQIRALREQRGWTQTDLAREAGMSQTQISRLENSYRRFTLKTLRKLASVFDVALMVQFVPFSRLVSETRDVSEEALRAMSFSDELAIREAHLTVDAHDGSGGTPSRARAFHL